MRLVTLQVIKSFGIVNPGFAVGNGQNRKPAAKGIDTLADVPLGSWIESGGDLVKDEQSRLAGQGSGQGDTLALAA